MARKKTSTNPGRELSGRKTRTVGESEASGNMATSISYWSEAFRTGSWTYRSMPQQTLPKSRSVAPRLQSIPRSDRSENRSDNSKLAFKDSPYPRPTTQLAKHQHQVQNGPVALIFLLCTRDGECINCGSPLEGPHPAVHQIAPHACDLIRSMM